MVLQFLPFISFGKGSVLSIHIVRYTEEKCLDWLFELAAVGFRRFEILHFIKERERG